MAESKGGSVPAAKSDGSGTWDKYASRVIGTMAASTLGLGTVVYHLLEDWSWVDSLYFSSVALTTVGFGDLHPTTDTSKLFTVLYIFAGVSLIGLVLNQFLKRLAKRASDRLEPRDSDSDH